jgi:hypothetical protein
MYTVVCKRSTSLDDIVTLAEHNLAAGNYDRYLNKLIKELTDEQQAPITYKSCGYTNRFI